MREFGENLKKLRVKRELTIKQLALIINVNPKTISSWEKDRSTPNAEALIKIVKFFNVTCNYMLGL